MKELKANTGIIQTHYPIRKRYTPRKRWTIAEKRKNFKAQVDQNYCVEAAYHRVIELVRKHHFRQAEAFYNRDLKTDHTEGPEGMHCFITSTFYWRLDCSFLYDYEVSFAFNDCPYENEVREMLKAFPLDRAATIKELQPDFKTFYEAVLNIQLAEFIYFS